MDKKVEIYHELSHKLAVKHLIERFCFEMEANEKLFGIDKTTLNRLKNDCHNEELFSEEEYKAIYDESKRLKGKISFINEECE